MLRQLALTLSYLALSCFLQLSFKQLIPTLECVLHVLLGWLFLGEPDPGSGDVPCLFSECSSISYTYTPVYVKMSLIQYPVLLPTARACFLHWAPSQSWFVLQIVPCQVRRTLQTAEGPAWSCISPCISNSSTLARWGNSDEILHAFLLQKLIYKLRTTTLSILES